MDDAISSPTPTHRSATTFGRREGAASILAGMILGYKKRYGLIYFLVRAPPHQRAARVRTPPNVAMHDPLAR